MREAREGRSTPFGIYTRDGLPMDNTDIGGVKYFTRSRDRLEAWPQDYAQRPGEVFYGGHATDQFGFTILNSLGRLWAIDRVEAETPLLYHSDIRQTRIRFLRPLLDLLSVPNPILHYTGPMRVGSAVVANDLFGEQLGGRTTPEFRNWLAERLPPTRPVDPDRKVYLTRTALSPKLGRIACEDVLEQNLAANGYEIVAPETLDLAGQIALYQSAGTLLFPESSALHLFALVKRPEQSVGIISRRREIPPLILNQMTAFAPAPPEIFDAIDRIFYPPTSVISTSIAQLDFARLGRVLSERKYIPSGAPWRSPTKEELQASLESGLAENEALVPEEKYAEFARQIRRLRRRHGRAQARQMISKIRV